MIVMPHSKEAEVALLSSLFVDPEQIKNINMATEALYFDKCKAIYRALVALMSEDKPIDVISVKEELRRQGVSNIDVSEVNKVANAMPTGQRAEYYAGVVKEKHLRRKAIDSMYNAMEMAKDEGQDIREVIATVQSELDLPVDQRNKIASVYPEILTTWEQIVDLREGGEPNYITTGLVDLDKYIRLAHGSHTIIGGSPGEGKTSLAIGLLRHIAKLGKRPLMFTLEQTRERIMQNVIAQEAGVCYNEMIAGQLGDVDRDKVFEETNKWANPNICILDGRWGVMDIRSRAIREHRDLGLDAIIVDLLGLLEWPPDMSKSASEHQVFNTNSKLLQNLGSELKVPVITTAHLNRNKYKRKSLKPILSDLREAGEQFADIVIFIHHEYFMSGDEDYKGIAELLIPKNRDGELGKVEVGWDGPSKNFSNLARRDREDEVVWAGGKQ